MADRYTGKEMDRRYVGEQVDVTYNVRRCIHAQECVNRLSEVFDRDGRPWIHPDQAAADAITEVVVACPSGALHVDRKDGGRGETAAAENTIHLWQDGPIQITGDLAVSGAAVDMQHETRITLCRCGESAQKPFCDNSHLKTGFQSDDSARREGQITGGGRLNITAEANGPYEVQGPVQIFNAAGDLLFAGERVTLCRCGYSSKRPFCDGTHNQIHFNAE